MSTAANTACAMAEDFRAAVAGAADETERLRELPADLVAALKTAGVFRQLIPTGYGGLSVALPDFVRSLQCYAEADASTAWCISQGSVIATTSMWLPEASARTIWTDPESAVANGPPRICEAEPAAEGYRVTGHWGFSSGSAHANWMHGALRRTSDNVWMGVYFPKAQAEFDDNWQVAGLKGTSSLEFRVNDLPVDEAWMCDFRKPPLDDGPLYRIPVALIFAVSFGAVALGVARAGMDAAIDLAQGKVPGYSSTTVKDDPDMQKMIGEAEMRWRAARAFLLDTVDTVWNDLTAQDAIHDSQRVDLRMAGTNAINDATAALDLAYKVAGLISHLSGEPTAAAFPGHARDLPACAGTAGALWSGGPLFPRPSVQARGR